MIGMFNCMARLYSTPGSLARCVGALPPCASIAARIAAGVVHKKCVVILSTLGCMLKVALNRIVSQAALRVECEGQNRNASAASVVAHPNAARYQMLA